MSTLRSIFFALLLVYGSSGAMKREVPVGQPEQKAKIARVAYPEILNLQDLPDEILKLIIEKLTIAKGGTERTRLYKAAESIRALLMTNSFFTKYLNDISFNGALILELARRYTNHNIVEAAIALGTQAGGRWLNSYMAHEPDDLLQDDDTDAKLAALQAITQGQEEVLNFLLYNYPDMAHKISEAYTANGKTFFIEALYRNNAKVIQALIDAGVDINVPERPPAPGLNPGSSALAVAISLGITDVVNILLDADVDVNAPGWTEIDEEGRRELLVPLVWAMRRPDRTTFKRLLNDPDIDINMSLHGFTPLFYAVEYYDFESLRDLLQAHADPNIINDVLDQEDEDKRTALLYAIRADADPERAQVRTQMIQLLLQHGADVNLGAGIQLKPLMVAAHARPDLVPLFIKAGAQVNAQDIYGRTALSFAVQAAHADAVEDLIKAGANIMHALSDGQTIFALAQQLPESPAKTRILKLLEDRRTHLGL